MKRRLCTPPSRWLGSGHSRPADDIPSDDSCKGASRPGAAVSTPFAAARTALPIPRRRPPRHRDRAGRTPVSHAVGRGASPPGRTPTGGGTPGFPEVRRWRRRRGGMERETGFEPATNSLEGCDSTPELLPRLGDEMDGGGGWIRTNVGLRRQIYSLLPLTARPLLRVLSIALGRALEPAPGVEPGTYGLQDRRSTG